MRYKQYGEQPQFGGGIGASAGVLTFNDGTVAVVDWGVALENNPVVNLVHPPAGDWLRGTKVRWIFVTHAHLDHIGAIPRLVAEHPEVEAIFMSRKTFELGRILLEDSLKIAVQDAYRSGREAEDAIYTRDDLDNFISSSKLCLPDENEWMMLPDGWRIAMPAAGHIVGARSVLLDPPAGINDRPVYCTGDRSSVDQHTVRGVVLPSGKVFGDFFAKPNLVVVTEATNGNKNPRKSRGTTEKELVGYVSDILNSGGIAFCPAFAVNRCAEIVLMLVRAGISGIHVDGMARRTMEVEVEPGILKMLLDSGIVIFLEDDRAKARQHRQLLATGNDPCSEHPVIVSPSAMMDKGHAVEYAEMILHGRKNGVVLPGYLFPGSPAWEIYNKLRRGDTVTLIRKNGHTRKVQVPVRCEVRHFDLSAHDFRPGLVKMLRQAHPADVIVHHASAESYDSLAAAVVSFITPGHMYRGEHGKDIEL